MKNQNEEIERELLTKKSEIIAIETALEDTKRTILQFEHQIEVLNSEKQELINENNTSKNMNQQLNLEIEEKRDRILSNEAKVK